MPRNNRSKQSSQGRRERTTRGRAYRISVRGERRANPDVGKVARVVVALALAQAQAEADAQAAAEATAPTQDDVAAVEPGDV